MAAEHDLTPVSRAELTRALDAHREQFDAAMDELRELLASLDVETLRRDLADLDQRVSTVHSRALAALTHYAGRMACSPSPTPGS